jgi:arylsulfatase
MNRRIRIIAGVLAGGVTLLAGSPGAAAVAARPNIVLILADDLGFSDLGCFGGEISTPNLDRLAQGGLRFRQAYNAAVCVATRSSLLTGLYPHQAGFEQKGGPLLTRIPTIADLLRAAGYRTYISGKWHLGTAETKTPQARGFDRQFGIYDGASNYFKSTTIRPTPVFLEGKPYAPRDDFCLTGAISDHAIRFLREGLAER